MAYPSPTIYTYRVTQVPAILGRAPARYIPEFSTDSGTTWRPVSGEIFQSFDEAMGAIAFEVSDEAAFRTRFLAGIAFTPTPVLRYSYPSGALI